MKNMEKTKKFVFAVRLVLSAALMALGFYLVAKSGENAVAAGAGFGLDGTGITGLLRSLLR